MGSRWQELSFGVGWILYATYLLADEYSAGPGSLGLPVSETEYSGVNSGPADVSQTGGAIWDGLGPCSQQMGE